MTSNYNYYGKNKHNYLRYDEDHFAYYIYSLIFDDSFLNFDRAIEFGAGMGRFSAPIVNQFSDTTLVEPIKDYTDILQQKFLNKNVCIINDSAEAFLKKGSIKSPAIIFCFHLMHHLTYKQRQTIYQFIKNTGSKGVLVEPNPLNPLILIQTLLYPTMKLANEIQFIKMTHRRYKNEIEENNLSLTKFKKLCVFPPFALNFLLKRSHFFIRNFERLNSVFPFIGAYQLICFERID